MPDDSDAPPVMGEEAPPPAPVSEAPVGFWSDLVQQLKGELKPPVSGLFSPSPDAPVQGVLVGNVLQLRCTNTFICQVVGKPDIMLLVGQKASALLGRQIRAEAVDGSAQPAVNSNMSKLLEFGRDHSNIVRIKE